MVNIYGLCVPWLPLKVSQGLALGVFICSLVYVFAIWARLRSKLLAGQERPAEVAFELESWAMAVTLTLANSASLHTHYHDCTSLALAAAFTLKSLSLRQAAREPCWSWRFFSLILLFYPMLSWLCYIYRDHFPLLGYVNLALTALAIVQFERLIKETRAPDNQPVV
jgi:hypothetical protein